jgi:hypothetical protein
MRKLHSQNSGMARKFNCKAFSYKLNEEKIWEKIQLGFIFSSFSNFKRELGIYSAKAYAVSLGAVFE